MALCKWLVQDTTKQFPPGVDSEDLCSGQLLCRSICSCMQAQSSPPSLAHSTPRLDLVADLPSDDDKPEPEFHWIESWQGVEVGNYPVL